MKKNKIIQRLIKKKISISVAESCTGGLVASEIISTPDSSKIFNLGITRWKKLLNQLNPDLFIEDSGNIKFNLLLKNILKEKQTC